MDYGMDWNGGTHHTGTCPECKSDNGTSTNGLCDYCDEHKTVKCPACFDMVDPAYMTEFGVCIVCHDGDEEENKAAAMTHRIQFGIDMTLLCEEMMNDIQIITKNYKR